MITVVGVAPYGDIPEVPGADEVWQPMLLVLSSGNECIATPAVKHDQLGRRMAMHMRWKTPATAEEETAVRLVMEAALGWGQPLARFPTGDKESMEQRIEQFFRAKDTVQ